MWRYTPLAAWTNADRAIAWAADFSNLWWAPLVVILAYTPACIVLFPRAFITLLAVAAFGAWHGLAYAMCGILLACALTYYVGTQDESRDRAPPRARQAHAHEPDACATAASSR